MLNQKTKQVTKKSDTQAFKSSKKLLELAAKSHEQYLVNQQEIDLENAIDYYVRAMKLTPHLSEPYYKLAILLYNKRQISLDQALKQCKKAVLLDPVSPMAKLYYGYFLSLSGQVKLAKQEFLKAIKLNFFTSSNHLTGFPDIDRAPFALKNYDACKQNVIDLCANVGITEQKQIDTVLTLFDKYFDMFKSKEIMVALIPKRVVKKNFVKQEVLDNKNLLETIIYLSDDINEEYKEHFGNVWNGSISSKNFYVINLPILENFISINNFARETKDELFELSAVEHMKRHLARILNSIGETDKADALLNNKEVEDDESN